MNDRAVAFRKTGPGHSLELCSEHSYVRATELKEDGLLEPSREPVVKTIAVQVGSSYADTEVVISACIDVAEAVHERTRGVGKLELKGVTSRQTHRVAIVSAACEGAGANRLVVKLVSYVIHADILD